MQSLSETIRNSPVRVVPGRYAVVKCAGVPAGFSYFMVARDADEITVIAEESEVLELQALEVENGYTLLEIKVAAPFQGVGFLATVSGAIAAAGLNMLIVSTYSKDYILLKEETATLGIQALSSAGFPVMQP
jgi:hypothetical protein